MGIELEQAIREWLDTQYQASNDGDGGLPERLERLLRRVWESGTIYGNRPAVTGDKSWEEWKAEAIRTALQEDSDDGS